MAPRAYGKYFAACFWLCVQSFLIVQVVDANAFLKADHKAQRMNEADVMASLRAEMEGTLGHISDRNLDELKALLEPMFVALPKNAHGGIEHTTVRYALRRFFVQRHGWFVQGLDRTEPSAQSLGVSSSATVVVAGILKEQVPAYVQDLLEKIIGAKGFGLHELAVFANVIEHLVHNEVFSLLSEAFDVHQHLPSAQLAVKDADEVLETYMMAYILGQQVLGKSLRSTQLVHINKFKEKMPTIFRSWQEARSFIQEMRKNITGSAEQLDFAAVASVAERMGEQFGSFQYKECHQLKEALLTSEVRGTGRVRLSDFYKPAFGGQDGSWQFQESVPYLRELGALDESDVAEPLVIVTNYLGSQTNCVESSSFYSVCCMNECEKLLGHIESRIRKAWAWPSHIASVVHDLPSSSVSAPLKISKTLRKRLDEIADSHSGNVPLHGRLFAQWMHHVYPRECPYPHLSGTTSPKGARARMEANGQSSEASMEEMRHIIENSASGDDSRNSSGVQLQGEDDEAELIPWSPEEELLVVRAAPKPTPAQFFDSGSNSLLYSSTLLCVVAMAVSIVVVRLFRSTMCTEHLDDASYQKCFV
jgi:hypothetical protein